MTTTKWLWVCIAIVVLMAGGLAGLATATHNEGCQPGGADPKTLNTIGLENVGGGVFYIEERDAPSLLRTQPPIPGSGTITTLQVTNLGSAYRSQAGTWVYEEGNGISGLQRGGLGLFGDWFPPGCDQSFDPLNQHTWDGEPCLIIDLDPITDENCTHQPDHLIM